MIEVTGSNGHGYRIFYPWFHRADRSLTALRIPGPTLVRRWTLFNAALALVVIVPHMQELRGHPSSADGWIYLIALSMLIIELAWKVKYLWLRVRIERPALKQIPTSSRLYGEHVMFWMAMQVALISSIDHSHPSHSLWWTGVSLLCTLMLLMPLLSKFILRHRSAA